MAEMPREIRLDIKVPEVELPPTIKLAKVLQVVNDGGFYAQLYIDGEPFVWATADGHHIHAASRKSGQLPAVTVTIVAERVEVLDSLDLGRHAAEAEEVDRRTET